jgi:NADP-dependent 3-hydroxy acid dehydrogenase YdfG
MPTIALVAAGARLGLSLGRVFGRQGFDVALIARSPERLGGLVAALADDGIRAAGFAADATDSAALTTALDTAAARFGGIDVLHYSSVHVGGSWMTQALDVTVENLRPEVESICYSAINATRAVLPTMLGAGRGALLYTTGASSVLPTPWAATAGAAGAALRNWVLTLHDAVAEKGVYVGHVAIGAWITGTPGAPDGASTMEPDAIARVYWDLYNSRDRAEHLIGF